MSSLVITTVSAARATANDWLVSHLPDRFAAGIPEYEQSLQGWRIPVWLSYPQLEPLGPVGELIMDEATGDVREHTAINVMKERAISLYEKHRDEIEAPLL
jgi:hypothetical protein